MKITNKIGYVLNAKISKTKSAKKKEVSEVLTDENIEKVKQLAYRDAMNGSRSNESTSFLHQCREKVAPDRKKVFIGAEKEVSAEIDKYRSKIIS